MNISTTYCYSQSLRFRFTVYLFIIGLLSIFSLKLHAQEKPRSYIIAGISVEGNTYADAQTIISISGLRIGEEIKIPGAIQQEAIRNLWQRNQFSDISLTLDKITVSGVFLSIKVKEFPRFNRIIIDGNDKVSDKEIEKGLGKVKGDILSPYEVNLAKKTIQKLYEKEG